MYRIKIEGAIDLHCHAGPDTIGGTLDYTEHHPVDAVAAAREAAAEGHAAVVLKSHSFASPVLARTVDDLVPGIRVFGGICTDGPTGGLNVGAVEAALSMGAKVVWLPTVNSTQDFERFRVKWPHLHLRGGAIPVVDDHGHPVPAVNEIADLVHDKGAVLATGHTTAREHYAVVKALAPRCPIVVTHAGETRAGPALSAVECSELADLGATIEISAQTCRDQRMSDTDKCVSYIREIGVDRCTLSSDYGWFLDAPHPAAGLSEFYEFLWGAGVSEAELKRMASANPARLLDIQVP